MILYFDSYITDIPLKGRDRSLLKEDIRKNCSAYVKQKRLDVAKYVLASYTIYPWSHVLIKYELDEGESKKEFDAYLRKLFPKITIIHKRSADQNEYKESLKELKKLKDPWIFYSPNNDHPLVSSNKNVVSYIDGLLELANKWKKKYKYVSIMYSHFSEFLNIPVKGNPEHFLHGQKTTILEETPAARVYHTAKDDFSSVQIVHMDQMTQWFSSKNLGDKRVIRAEDTLGTVHLGDQVIIAPKKELCAHFDGYEHMLGHPNEIQIDLIPPLFIPKGFFTNNIKIAYGYDKYREGWVNINPLAKEYSFRDKKYGTDMKIGLKYIPLFWKSHIKTIDVNKAVDKYRLEQAISINEQIKYNPWNKKYFMFKFKHVRYWIQYYSFSSYIRLRKSAAFLKKNVL